jgi:protein-tyrosine phosphatase
MTADILVVCTANQCRSPMAEALFRQALEQRGAVATVHSAGTQAVADIPATDSAIETMQAAGLDIGAHRSQAIDRQTLTDADVIVTMTREHLRDLATRAPGTFPRLFTIKELARRARDAGPRGEETVRDWATRLGTGRQTSDLLGTDKRDDVEDPIGRPLDVYEAVARELAVAIEEIVRAGWPPDSDDV